MSTERVELSAPEMDCASCAGKVRTALEGVEGVTSIDTRPTTGVAVVDYDPETVSVDTLIARVEAAGYEVTDTEGRITAGGDVWTTPRAYKAYAGAVAMVLGFAIGFGPVSNPLLFDVVRETTLSEALYVLGAAVAGAPVVRAGYQSAKLRELDIDLLMGAAIIAALGVGYYVEAATLAVLFSLAELLEAHAMDRTRESIRELLALSPETATVKRDGGEESVPAASVKEGDVVVVRPGERIPVDGDVLAGTSAVDESPITGESVPVDKTEGNEVYAGSVVEGGYLEIEASAAGDETTLSRVIDLVEQAESRRTDAERFVDRFAGYYTPTVVTAALLTIFVPPLLLGGAWGTWFVRGLTLLVIACPCAFVISTPVSVVSALTSAARNGVLVKGGDHLERMGEVDTVAFDKTGTLTTGDLAVTDVVPAAGRDEGSVLRAAAAVEQYSEHPVGQAIVDHATEAGVDAPDATDFENLAGRGVRADLSAQETYYVGKPGLFEELGHDLGHAHVRTDGGVAVETPDAPDCAQPGCVDLRAGTIADLQSAGKTVVLVGTETELVGVVAVADTVRPEAKRVIQALDDAGVRTVMLTGDNERTARAVADSVGIDEARAELLPEEKLDAIEELLAEGTVAMVGDGVNDAPALARADIGIAMGAAGTDAALETADIALMADGLDGVPYCLRLARKANGVIKQNIGASLAVKLLLAIGAPFGYVTVLVAVLVGDMGMSLAVTGNAFRLGRVEPEE
ncbi:MAG: Cd2+/Zn2+-exporting ATPase [Natronomonas sp.]|jgi:Cd2+/Zn2+-exporting ATPase|uniref:heavy metal translocating P-type ATPase n=1 Tax=Natronomonas sp. TaxID=2184060 RepID=UPI00398968A6